MTTLTIKASGHVASLTSFVLALDGRWAAAATGVPIVIAATWVYRHTRVGKKERVGAHRAEA